MHLIVTRTFPPEVGGMQNLMYGLAKSLSENVTVSYTHLTLPTKVRV